MPLRRRTFLAILALSLLPGSGSFGYGDWIISAYVSLNSAVASKIHLENLKFNAALDFITEKTRETNGDTINFTKRFKAATGDKVITVNAKNISMRALLDRICAQAHVSYAPDAHDQRTLILRDKVSASDKTQQDPVY